MKSSVVSYRPSFQGKYVINMNENKHVKYLSNYLLDIVREEHLPGQFARDFVELNTSTIVQDKNLQKKLKDLCVKFFAINK